MKNTVATFVTAAIGSLCTIHSADARSIVQVDIHGQVIFNATAGAPLSTVAVGELAHTSFQVDSDVFVDSIPGDVRAYNVIQPSYSLSFSGGASVGLGVGPAFFGVRDGDPVADGFFVSHNTTSVGGVFLSQAPYRGDFHSSYVGSTLSSVDILSAVGTYDFTGLTVFGYTIWQGSVDNVRMDINFDHMTITVVPSPATLFALVPLVLGVRGRRRR